MIEKFFNLIKPEISHYIIKKTINFVPEKKVKYDKFVNYKLTNNLSFKHPIGLAAGFDKNCDMVFGIKKMGFSFCEIGTVTPYPNCRSIGKKIIKLRREQTIFNKMGLPSEGFQIVKEKLKKVKLDDFIIGVNIGFSGKENENEKNKILIKMIEELNIINQCSYITLNVSCPNVNITISEKDISEIIKYSNSHKPILVKFSVDVEEKYLLKISEKLLNLNCKGFIIGNSSKIIPEKLENKNIINGSISGKFIHERSIFLIKSLRKNLGNNFTIIGCGGILTPFDAYETINSGANLIQIYSGFIFKGPKIINEILSYI